MQCYLNFIPSIHFNAFEYAVSPCTETVNSRLSNFNVNCQTICNIKDFKSESDWEP